VPKDSTLKICDNQLIGASADSIKLCGGGSNGTTTLSGKCFIYTPNPNYIGTDATCFIACKDGICDTTVLKITITNVNVPPVVTSKHISTPENTVYTGNIIGANDHAVSGNIKITTTIPVKNPNHGSILIDPSGSYTYTPNNNYTGLDTAIALVCDDLTPPECVNDTIFIIVTPKSDSVKLEIPEGFSPNGDGVNDTYVIKGLENYPGNSITIFNRWGDEVYSAKPYTNQWGGELSIKSIRIGNDNLPTGVYFYILDLGNGAGIKKGYIYLNR
jgi:gliding motility-associated-like protein